MIQSEETIQKAVVKFLRTVAPDCVTFSIPNGGNRSITEGRRLKETGVLKGIPDLCIVAPGGKAHFLELKTPKGVLSDAQREIHTRLMLSCIPYAVVHNIDEVRVCLQAWRIETRESKPVSV